MALDLPVYVLVTGLIRYPTYTPLIVRTLERAKSLGLIADYVISTWLGEIDSYVGMRDLLSRGSGTIVETTEWRAMHHPDVTTYNYPIERRLGWLMGTNVYFGMREMPADCFVFKTRLDMQFITSDDFLQLMSSLQDMDFSQPDAGCPLRRRIWVGKAHSLVPFWLDDRHVFGHRQDVEDMFHFATIHDSVAHPDGCIAEVRYFSHPWLRSNMLVRDLIRINWIRLTDFSEVMRAEILNTLYEFEAFYILRASYYDIISRYYYIGLPFEPDWEHYNRLDPQPNHAMFLGVKPKDRVIFSPNEERDPRFLRALEAVRSTPSDVIYASDAYRASFAMMEAAVRKFGQAVLPLLRVSRGPGQLGAEGIETAATHLRATLPLASQNTARIHAYTARQVGAGQRLQVDVAVSVDDGYQIPRVYDGQPGAITYFWRRKGEQEVFGWEQARKPFKNDIVGVLIDRLNVWAPRNRGHYEFIVDIIFETRFWMNIGIPFDIEIV